MKVKKGDWIYSYSKGIFRIEEIIERYYEEDTPLLGDNKVGDKMPTRTIISKKFLTATFKKSFGFESCDESCVSKLLKKDRNKLEKLLNLRPELLKEFNEFKIPQRQTVHNTEIQIDNESDLKKMNLLVEFINKGKTYIDIQNEMLKLDLLRLKAEYSGNYLLQYMNYNDELVNKRKVWRDAVIRKK